MNSFISFFSNIKNAIIALGAIFAGLYIAKQKYEKYKAQDKLKDIETKIAKTNVIIAKETAKSIAKSKKIETDTEVKVLRELNKKSKEVQQEMINIEKNIEILEAILSYFKEIKMRYGMKSLNMEEISRLISNKEKK